MERKKGIIGKHILIIFEDAKDHYARKEGICTDNSNVEVTIDDKHIIPKNRVIRMEVIKWK